MSGDTDDETVPRHVGRYEIVGPLAAGGMAEILLGRLVGPSGFQRAVVIKRILRHLAKRKDFVDMFLDEARIVASIRHPNVVQVHELGHEDNELFLVMEYLEGESTAGLMRRLHANGENLDFALCAYIVAEACSGLHAAHELADENGKSLGVVHRDVSPHNVFIGYGGAIKLLDFGIATASEESGRIAQTEAGQFKGKLEYSSPEQCRGKPLDRRSDIFALGTILWELTTGMRLFKRPNALDMAKAICERPIPTPQSIVKEYPEDLVPIVTKALARNRKDRYQTALELRKDLLGVIRKLTQSVSPDEDIATVMRRLFKERIDEKAEMLRKMQRGTAVASVVAGETDDEVDLPVAAPEADPSDFTETDAHTDTDPIVDPTLMQGPPASLAVGKPSPSSPQIAAAPPAEGSTRGHTRKISKEEVLQAQALVAQGVTQPIGAESGPDTSSGTGTGTGTGTTAGVSTPGEFRPSALPHSPLKPIAIGAAVLVAAIGIILIAVSVGARAVDRRDTSAAGSASASPSATALASNESTAPPPGTPPSSSNDTEPTPGATHDPSTPHDPNGSSKADTMQVHIETIPAKATIYVNGTKKGVSPIDIKLAKGTTPVNVEIRQAGFVTVKEKVVPDANQKLRITLTPGPAPASSGAPYHRFD